MSEFAYIELPLIEPSRTNPRKNFNAAKLAELAESIKATGVHQPVLVRPLPGSRVEETTWLPGSAARRTMRPAYELVCGERRMRASHLAKVATIPALIRDLTDDQVLEIQIVENLQRDDLTELEEAEGYDALMTHSGINADAVGVKIGKSRAYVYSRLKLLDLSMECKDAMRAGKIDASRALLIARIPSFMLQAKALAEATKLDYKDEVMSVRALQTWLQQNVMLKLEHAKFKITDSRLVKDAGSCKDCPKRTGANPDLFADVAGADVCTDPDCYHAKEQAHRDALRTMAEKKGMRVIEGEEALELLASQHSNQVEGYSPLSQIRNDITLLGNNGHTLRSLLGTDAPAPVLFEHPRTKELIELVPTDEAEGVLLAKGLLKTEQTTAVKDTRKLEQQLEYLQHSINKDTRRAVRNALVADTKRAILATDDRQAKALLATNVLRAWLNAQFDIGQYDADDIAAALAFTIGEGLDESDALTRHINTSNHATLCRAMAVLLVSDDDFGQYVGSSDTEPLMLNAFTENLAVDVKAITRKATKAIKDDYAAQAKAIQAEIDAQNPPLPLPPLALPQLADSKAKTKKGPAYAAQRKPKTTPEEALSGIADAMQSMDRAATAPPEVPANEPGTTLASALDPLYDRALALVIKEQKASVRLFKATLGVGQTRAEQVLDLLQAAGKVSGCDVRGARKVLVQA